MPFLGLPGRRMQWVFDKSLVWGGEASHLSIVSSGADELTSLPNDDLIAVATTELFEALPEARRARVLRATVYAKSMRHSRSLPINRRDPSTSTQVANLFLAGDWIDTGLPATIESA